MSVPPQTAVFPDDRFGIAQPRGAVTAADIVELATAIAFHEDWEPGYTEVWDMRFSGSVDIVPSDIAALLDVERATKEALQGSTTLIVTPRHFLLFSAQFYARLVKPFGRTVVAVETAEAAAEALGIAALPDLSASADAS